MKASHFMDGVFHLTPILLLSAIRNAHSWSDVVHNVGFCPWQTKASGKQDCSIVSEIVLKERDLLSPQNAFKQTFNQLAYVHARACAWCVRVCAACTLCACMEGGVRCVCGQSEMVWKKRSWMGSEGTNWEEIPGSRRSMRGYILTYSRLYRQNLW